MKKTIKLSLILILASILAIAMCVLVSCVGTDKSGLEISVSNETDIRVSDSLESVKQYLAVTYTDSNGKASEVTDYELQGTLTEGQTTLTVKYQGLSATCKITVKAAQYDVVFKADGVVVGTLHYTTANDTVIAPQVPVKTGYEGEWEKYSLTTGNITVNAIYTAKTYTLLLDYNGAEDNNQTSVAVTYGQRVGALPIPFKADCMFDGWLLGGTEVDSQTIWRIDTQDQLTMKAQWIQMTATDGLLYELSEDGQAYTVTGIVERFAVSNIVIPSTYNGKPVTRIEDGAFVNSKITSVVVPDSVTSMGKKIFNPTRVDKLHYLGDVSQWCGINFDGMIFDIDVVASISKVTKLADVYIAGGKVVDLVIPDNVTTINPCAFATVFCLESVTIPRGVKSIGNCAFGYCLNLQKVTFSEDLESIGEAAFIECPLKQAVLPNSLTNIGSMAFFCCGLQSVVIPSRVTEIGDEAFSGCFKLFEVYNLSSLDIPAGSVGYGYVAENAKYVYSSLDEPRKIAETVDGYGYEFLIDGDDVYLVGYNGNDSELTLPTDCNGKRYNISGLAFCCKTSITSVTVPKEVLSICDYAFSGCIGLTDVYIEGDVSDWCRMGGIGNAIEFYGITVHLNGQELTDLTNVVLSDDVTAVPDYAFYGCTELTEITLGRNVNKVEYYAFYGCGDINTIRYAGDIAGWCAVEGLDLMLSKENLTVYVDGEKLNDITSLTLPEGVKYTNTFAFEVCTKLKELTVLGEAPFSLWFTWCPIEVATVPLSYVPWLPGENMKKVEVTKVDKPNWSGFSELHKLQVLVLCEDVTAIEDYTFDGCGELMEIVYKGTVEQWNKIELGENWRRGCPVRTIICQDGQIQLY